MLYGLKGLNSLASYLFWGAFSEKTLCILPSVACEACQLAAFLLTCFIINLGHLCFLAVLLDLCPYATYHQIITSVWEVWSLYSFLFSFTFRSMALLSCKMPLFLLSIIGLMAIHLEIKGRVALSIKKL